MSLSLCILSLLLQIHSLTVETNGSKLFVIHPESPESPFFERNLTQEQRIQRLMMYQHQPRVSSSYDMNPDFVRPQIETQFPYYYMVKIGIGSFKSKPPFKSYYLYMDTGSDLMWLQCEGCRAPGRKCFPQKEPVYPNSVSASYHPLACNKHSLCVPNQCINGSCSYNIRYLDSTFSSGILAYENFAFNSDTGKIEVVKNLVFGCGIDNWKNYGDKNSNNIAGIMGLGWGSYSIINQAYSLTQGKFSYCLPRINQDTHAWPNTYLRFGKDIIQRANYSVTPLLRYKNQKVYRLILQGISINNQRLKIPHQDFELRDDGSGGCIIDSGTPFSRVIRPVYMVLEKALKSYFHGKRNLKPYKGPTGFDLCYERRKRDGYKNLVSMTFHFEGNANLVIRPEALFIVMDKISSAKGEYFCLAILQSDTVSVLGSYQQTNQRFVYDTEQKHLAFHTDDCSKDAY